MNSDDIPSIPEWFTGKNVFLTGGSGFIGKNIIEKLLRSCPKLGNIYVLMRPKKGLNAKERIQKMFDLPLFDRLKKEQPNAPSKVIPIEGDAAELDLQLNWQDRKLLVDNINIVYHCAASVRFDDSLTKSLLLNTRGTREVCKLTLEMKNVEFFMHVSTAYCNADRKRVEEILYPPFTDWKKAIEIAERTDPQTLTILTEKFIHPLPNTYTFSKQLAEHVVNDMLSGKVLAAIGRPSIVISSMKEPEPGYCENFNGPVGIFVGYGKGVLRVVYSEPDIVVDFVPVDICVKGLIIATWKTCNFKDEITETKQISIFNGSNQKIHPLTNQEICDVGLKLLEDYPLDPEIWNPNVVVTSSRYYFYYMVFFCHVLPAILIDSILWLTNHKPMLYKIQKRIFTANIALEHFIMNDWEFINEKGMNLEKSLKPCDIEDFSFEIYSEAAKPKTYFKNAVLGGKKFLLKEDINKLDIARKKHYRMWLLAKVFTFAWYGLLLWLFFIKFNMPKLIKEKLCNYLDNLQIHTY